MTAVDAPPPPPPPPTGPPPSAPPSYGVRAPLAPPAPRTPASAVPITAFVVVAVTWALYLLVKVLVPVFDGQSFKDQVDTIAAVFGVLGLLSVLPIAAGIVLGHLGMRRSQRAKRGRMLGVIALVGGYLLLALYLNRIIVAIVALIAFPSGANFLENNFFWA